MLELAALADQGWDVEVTGYSPYFPGRTVEVLVWRPGRRRADDGPHR
jgi:hypothetical protein